METLSHTHKEVFKQGIFLQYTDSNFAII
jgi:hypothetical protein